MPNEKWLPLMSSASTLLQPDDFEGSIVSDWAARWTAAFAIDENGLSIGLAVQLQVV